MSPKQPNPSQRRTCVACGRRDDAAAMVCFVLADGVPAVASLPGEGRRRPGRGAHVHPRPACLSKSPRGLARALRAEVRADAPEIGARVAEASAEAMAQVVEVARRSGAVQADLDGEAALVLVAVDADEGTLRAVAPAVGAGRALAWWMKRDLGALIGKNEAASCGVRDGRLARKLIDLRLAADAGMQTAARATREGAECSSRCPEAR